MGKIEPMLRLADVRQVTGVAKSTIYRWIDEGLFPRPVPIGPGSVAWRESEIAAWQNACVEARQAPQ